MERTYEAELAALPQTYAHWESWRGNDRIGEVRARLGGIAAFVASGGSLAVAHFGAMVYQRRWMRAAVVLTPLEFAVTRIWVDTVFIISDSMSHPDALLAVAVARKSPAQVIVVLSNRSEEYLRQALGDGIEPVACPRPGNDGWIATNSVLSLSLGVLTVLGADDLPPRFPTVRNRWLEDDGRLSRAFDTARPFVICLYTPALRSAAVDLETRTAEAGLCQVSATDLRNLGHGRHVGLYRNAAATAVVIMVEPQWTPLAEGTVASLPADVEARIWASERPDAWGAIELLLPSAGFLAARAARVGADPGNPVVWPGGLTLFRTQLDQMMTGALI